MKFLLTLTTLALIASGCASTTGQSASEATPGKFVGYTCDNKKTFSARFDAETKTVRVRSHDGSFEMTRGDRGLYRDDDGLWVLALGGGNSTELVHKGKATYTNCAANS